MLESTRRAAGRHRAVAGPPSVSCFFPPRHLQASIREFVEFFSTRGRNHFRSSLARLKLYRPMIEKVFFEEGLPVDLAWIGLWPRETQDFVPAILAARQLAGGSVGSQAEMPEQKVARRILAPFSPSAEQSGVRRAEERF